LGQVFFIGDGLTNDGVRQIFKVPANATRLFLGVADGMGFVGRPGAYEDNDGSFQVEIEQPTVITLLSFITQANADHVSLTWQTGTEIDNAGFNLYRATTADGPYTKLNDALIPAEGDPVSGGSYAYTDNNVIKGVTYYYKLEDVDFHGVSTFHGPVSATPTTIRRIYLPIILNYQ
jgi:hypothetical protein